MDAAPRWFTETPDTHSQWYVDRFRQLAAEGADLAGEARLVDALVSPGSRVLDAGCGPGRLASALHDRGHDVTGVDVDPVLLEAAQQDHPGPKWMEADLSTLDLGEQFDAVVCAGNVLVFVAPGTESTVLERLADHVAPGGVLVVGCRMDRQVDADLVDAAVRGRGLEPEQRFATWDLRPFAEDSDFLVCTARRPESVAG